MYNETYEFKNQEPFLVPFCNIPYIYNGSTGSLIRGASCFSLFILNEQRNRVELNDTVDYLFTEEECYKEISVTSKITTEERLGKTQDFFEEHFMFFTNVSFQDNTKLFVFTAFLDQLATDCFQYIEFNEPTASNYISAFKNIELLAEHRGLSKDKIKKYKKELIELLSSQKPIAYFAIIFNAA